MSRYIDKDVLLNRLKKREIFGFCKLCDYYENCSNHKGTHKDCWRRISLPEADAVEVVRCKDCKYHGQFSCLHPSVGRICDENDYCSYGERAKDELDKLH